MTSVKSQGAFRLGYVLGFRLGYVLGFRLGYVLGFRLGYVLGFRLGYSANIQRSWQKPEDKGTDNWQRQSVSLFPDELLKVAALCVRTYNELTAGLQKEREERRDRPAANYPSQSYDAPEPPAYLDDVPMDF